MKTLEQRRQRRDEFAKAAMQGIIIGLGTDSGSRLVLEHLAKQNNLEPRFQVAKMAYEQADAMLEWERMHTLKP